MKLQKLLVALLLLPTLLPCSARAQEEVERPSAMRLFPYETIAFARVAHGRELYERFRQTGFGGMLNDPEMTPFIDATWGFAGDQYTENAAENVGFDWEDFSRIPKGELAIGLVDRGKANMGVLVLADFDGARDDIDFFLEKFDERWANEGMVVETEDVEGEQMTIVRQGDDRSSSFGYLVKDTCLVGSNDETLLRHVLDRWAGRAPMVEPPEGVASDEELQNSDEPLTGERSLAENDEFATILQECSTQLEESPQVVLYANPITLIRRAFAGNTGAAVAIATFPALGLDGILGVGGTATFATDNWDSVSHLHLLLGNPRSGVLTLLRFKSGNVTPPNYVPANVYGYSTLYMDAPGIYERLVQLVDRFRYEGAFEDSIENGISERLGVDFKEVVINNLAGRATLVTSYDEPRRFQGEQRAVTVTLIDPELAIQALTTIVEKFGQRIELQDSGGVEYFALVPRRFRDVPEDERPLSPCFAVLDDTLIASSSTPLLHAMIESHQGTRPRLADSIEFKVIQSRVERLTHGQELALFYYENAVEVLRHWYEVSQTDQALDGLSQLGENSTAAAGFLEVLETNDLPPFELIEEYMTPTGGYLIDTNTGLHFMAFDVRNAGDE